MIFSSYSLHFSLSIFISLSSWTMLDWLEFIVFSVASSSLSVWYSLSFSSVVIFSLNKFILEFLSEITVFISSISFWISLISFSITSTVYSFIPFSFKSVLIFISLTSEYNLTLPLLSPSLFLSNTVNERASHFLATFVVII